MATYCNPIPLPDYPRGVMCSAKHKKNPMFWIGAERRDFRETADPTVVYDEENARWILYPSGRMAYVSEDLVNWRHHPIEPASTGYAPTVVKVGRQWWLTACGAPIFVSDSPLGPFEKAGDITLPDGNPLPKDCSWLDPMIFADDDGRIYAYWGISVGIFGAEMDASKPGRLLTHPERFIQFNPENQWERGGRFHQHEVSCTEGAWMLKANGRYWLNYSAPGSNPMYCMGTYVGESPLGPFQYARRNPILDGRGGRFVQGAGHGCLVRGPKDTLWAFYTCHIQNHHAFERRIGMEPAGFDSEGNLSVCSPSDTPQLVPGAMEHPEIGNSAGWEPVSFGEQAKASSEAPGREARYAVDLNPNTWWQAAQDDALPWIELDLYQPQKLKAVRIHWKEPGLDYDNGAAPVPMRWRLEVRMSDKDPWQLLLDKSGSAEDWLIAYHDLPDAPAARHVRMSLTEHPGKVGIGLLDFSLFAPVIQP